MDRSDSMTFFSFETILPELETDGFVVSFVQPFGVCYELTESGQDSVSMFSDSIPQSLRERITEILSDSSLSFRRETQTTSRLTGDEQNGYHLELLVLDGGKTVFGITLAVASKEAALVLRSRWEAESSRLYDVIWDSLYRGSMDEEGGNA